MISSQRIEMLDNIKKILNDLEQEEAKLYDQKKSEFINCIKEYLKIGVEIGVVIKNDIETLPSLSLIASFIEYSKTVMAFTEGMRFVESLEKDSLKMRAKRAD